MAWASRVPVWAFRAPAWAFRAPVWASRAWAFRVPVWATRAAEWATRAAEWATRAAVWATRAAVCLGAIQEVDNTALKTVTATEARPTARFPALWMGTLTVAPQAALTALLGPGKVMATATPPAAGKRREEDCLASS